MINIALFTRYKLTRVPTGLVSAMQTPVIWAQLGLVCRINTANPGSTRVSLEKCRVNTTRVSFNRSRTRVSLCRVNRAYHALLTNVNPVQYSIARSCLFHKLMEPCKAVSISWNTLEEGCGSNVLEGLQSC